MEDGRLLSLVGHAAVLSLLLKQQGLDPASWLKREVARGWDTLAGRPAGTSAGLNHWGFKLLVLFDDRVRVGVLSYKLAWVEGYICSRMFLCRV